MRRELQCSTKAERLAAEQNRVSYSVFVNASRPSSVVGTVLFRTAGCVDSCILNADVNLEAHQDPATTQIFCVSKTSEHIGRAFNRFAFVVLTNSRAVETRVHPSQVARILKKRMARGRKGILKVPNTLRPFALILCYAHLCTVLSMIGQIEDNRQGVKSTKRLRLEKLG